MKLTRPPTAPENYYVMGVELQFFRNTINRRGSGQCSVWIINDQKGMHVLVDRMQNEAHPTTW